MDVSQRRGSAVVQFGVYLSSLVHLKTCQPSSIPGANQWYRIRFHLSSVECTGCTRRFFHFETITKVNFFCSPKYLFSFFCSPKSTFCLARLVFKDDHGVEVFIWFPGERSTPLYSLMWRRRGRTAGQCILFVLPALNRVYNFRRFRPKQSLFGHKQGKITWLSSWTWFFLN